eukprot:1158283-Pelagomonas_calceolata.AAC.2
MTKAVGLRSCPGGFVHRASGSRRGFSKPPSRFIACFPLLQVHCLQAVLQLAFDTLRPAPDFGKKTGSISGQSGRPPEYKPVFSVLNVGPLAFRPRVSQQSPDQYPRNARCCPSSLAPSPYLNMFFANVFMVSHLHLHVQPTPSDFSKKTGAVSSAAGMYGMGGLGKPPKPIGIDPYAEVLKEGLRINVSLWARQASMGPCWAAQWLCFTVSSGLCERPLH